MKAEDAALSLAELSAQAGLPGRTIRFYIARGLLPGPDKAGRGACYGHAHLERLLEIQRLQKQGLTLQAIGRQLGGPPAGVAVLEPEAWWQYPLADDVVVQVRADAPPWRLREIRNQLARVATQLRAGTTERNDERSN